MKKNKLNATANLHKNGPPGDVFFKQNRRNVPKTSSIINPQPMKQP